MSNELERLQAELAEAHDVRRAIADLMAIAANARDDLGSVLQQLAEIATRLCAADDAVVAHWEGDVVNLWHQRRGHVALPADAPTLHGRPGYVAYTTNQPVRVTYPIDDLAGAMTAQEGDRRPAGTTHGSALAVPMKTAAGAVGAVVITRYGNQAFGDRQQEILELFAAQAVIAIENARLFNALQQSNSALARGLERETATAHILRTISASPGELEGVLAAIGHAAMRLCAADHAAVGFSDADGTGGHIWDPVRGFRSIERSLASHWRNAPDDRDHGVDTFAGPIDSWADEYPGAATIARSDGLTECAIVRVRPESGVGKRVRLIVRRNTSRAFEPEHIALLERFADQALIAIDNARVLNELQQRNRDVSAAGVI